MKLLLSITAVCLSTYAYAASFNDFTVSLEGVGAYSENANYDSQHCLVYFKSNSPSECVNKMRGVIYAEKSIGSIMCSVALAAFVSGKQVSISSHDECDGKHRSPVVRYIRVME